MRDSPHIAVKSQGKGPSFAFAALKVAHSCRIPLEQQDPKQLFMYFSGNPLTILEAGIIMTIKSNLVK